MKMYSTKAGYQFSNFKTKTFITCFGDKYLSSSSTRTTMEDRHIPILFFAFLFLLLSPSASASAAVDSISVNEAIKDSNGDGDGSTLVSHGKRFQLGFFSPKNTNNRYLGIWYNNISPCTVVWVANRDTPITDKSGIFMVGSTGRLLILNATNTVIWSSNSTLSVTNLPPVAQLLDTGNLVVRDINRNLIWQSFDHPGNTLLPGMKFGKDLVTGTDRYLTSWKTPDDPSPGHYLYSVDTNGFPQIFQRRGSKLSFRIGPWNGLRFHGLPIEDPEAFYSSEFVVNDKEIYYKYELKRSVIERIVVMPDGNTVQLHWMERTQDWVAVGNAAIDACGRYGVCGPYGSCRIDQYPPCSCLEGFVSTLQEQWKEADWSSGCQHREPLICGSGDGFKKFVGLKFPDTRRSWYNQSLTLGECEMTLILSITSAAMLLSAVAHAFF